MNEFCPQKARVLKTKRSKNYCFTRFNLRLLRVFVASTWRSQDRSVHVSAPPVCHGADPNRRRTHRQEPLRALFLAGVRPVKTIPIYQACFWDQLRVGGLSSFWPNPWVFCANYWGFFCHNTIFLSKYNLIFCENHWVYSSRHFE